ncbi:hypothetical protein N9W97_02930 [Pseudomonadales bacterium]|nr:hypothetical protein [Pseudomonadales bacterium]
MHSKLQEIFFENNLVIKQFSETKREWGEVILSGTTDNCFFDVDSVEYYEEYFKNNMQRENLSQVVFQNSQPVAVFVLEVDHDPRNKLITSNGGFVKSPVYLRELPKKVIKKINKSLLSYIDYLVSKQYKCCFDYEFDGVGCSDWYIALVTKCKIKELTHNLYVDLRFSLDDIKLNFRKSFRPLVNKGTKLWDVKIIDYGCLDIEQRFIEYRDFHGFVSGRKTRSDRSWDIQAAMVKNGKAFVVSIFDCDELIGFGFFSKNDSFCSYGVGVYDRDRFDEPLGHVVQFKAIEYMKKLGLTKYQLGVRFFSSQQKLASEKEISISHFKEGFANLILPSVVFEQS